MKTLAAIILAVATAGLLMAQPALAGCDFPHQPRDASEVLDCMQRDRERARQKRRMEEYEYRIEEQERRIEEQKRRIEELESGRDYGYGAPG